MITMILKGILLYSTVLSVLLFICGIDAIYDKGYFGMSFCIIFIEGLLCYITLSIDDICKLTKINPNDIDNEV